MLKFIPSVFNPFFWKKTWKEIQLAWYLLRDNRVPRHLKVIPFFVALYLLSPLDLVPGFLPVIGQLDDLGLLVMGLAAFSRLAPDDVVAEYKATKLA